MNIGQRCATSFSRRGDEMEKRFWRLHKNAMLVGWLNRVNDVFGNAGVMFAKIDSAFVRVLSAFIGLIWFD